MCITVCNSTCRCHFAHCDKKLQIFVLHQTCSLCKCTPLPHVAGVLAHCGRSEERGVARQGGVGGPTLQRRRSGVWHHSPCGTGRSIAPAPRRQQRCRRRHGARGGRTRLRWRHLLLRDALHGPGTERFSRRESPSLSAGRTTAGHLQPAAHGLGTGAETGVGSRYT